MEKEELRRKFREIRKNIPEKEKMAAAEAISRHFERDFPLPKHAILAGYYPTPSELSPLRVMRYVAGRGYRLALPVIVEEGAPLVFCQWEEAAPLLPHPQYGMLEPVKGKEVMPDIVLLPLLAFDAAGTRLGQGGGFYDRTLAAWQAAVKKVTAIGIGFACQQAETPLPCGAHDKKMEYILTENGLKKI